MGGLAGRKEESSFSEEKEAKRLYLLGLSARKRLALNE
jgi:hypothetical protein